jgi:hypothetical protein
MRENDMVQSAGQGGKQMVSPLSVVPPLIFIDNAPVIEKERNG